MDVRDVCFQAYYDSMVLRRIVLWLVCVIPLCMTCSKQFTSPIGTLTSPNYPQNYPKYQDCTTTITGPENTRLILSFIDFHLEYPRTGVCEYDYVQILGITATIDRHRYCGSKHVWHLVSRSNNVTIHFRSGWFIETKGFKLFWRTEDQFTYHTTPMTWTDAMASCDAEGGSLIRNDEVTRKQIYYLQDKPNFTDSWTSEYLTPWVWFKGCLRVEPYIQIGTSVRFKQNRMTVCQSHCSSFNYFALQDDQCFCLDEFEGDFVRPDENCNSFCPYSPERCGGRGRTYTIYMNDMCMDNSSTWTGTVAQTISGQKCDYWSKHYTASIDSPFPDGSVSNASNHCRNPDNRFKALWCIIGNYPKYCDVPFCFTRGNIPEGTPSRCMLFKIENGTASAFQADCTSQNYYFPFPPSEGQKQWSGHCYLIHLANLTASPSSCQQSAPFICQQAAVNCGERLTFDNGNFTSPGYPEPYIMFLNCVWTIAVSPGYVVNLGVDFDIETSHNCRDDFIAVYDGPNTKSDLLGKWCGNDSISGVQSTGGQITLRLRTDESVSSRGFIARWSAVEATHVLGGSNNRDYNERTETTDQSVTMYAAIATGAVVLVLILVVIFLVRRYRARKSEEARGDKSEPQVHCTNTSGRLELHVTNTALFPAGDNLADGVYDNPDFNSGTPTTEEADVYNHTDHSRAINNKPKNEQTMASDCANIYDHTKMDTQTPHDNLENKNSTGDVYDHTGTLTISRSGACKAAPGEDVYNTTSPQNVVHKDDTYNTLDQSFAEDDTYSHTLPRSKTHKDDTYNTFGQSFAEDDTYNSTLPRNNIHKDDTYNTLDQSFAKDDTYSHTLQRSQAHKDDTYNSLDQFADVDDTYQNTLPRK